MEPGGAGVWATEPGPVGSGDTETVEQASVFSEFDKAEADRMSDGGGPAIAPREEDPLSGFFFNGKPEDTDEAFPGGDKDGKSKARDFEW